MTYGVSLLPPDPEMTVAEANADAFWDRDPDEVSGSHELRIDDDIGGIYDTDLELGWTGTIESIMEEWADIKFENDNRPFLDWA